MANYYAENPEEFEELRINLPSASNPGHTPDATQSVPDTSIQPVAPMQPLSPPSDMTSDASGFIFPRLDATSPQGQTSIWQPMQDNTAAFAAPSDPVLSLSLTGIDMTAFTPGVPPTYSGVDFLNHLQGFPTQSCGDLPSSIMIPGSVTVPTISASSAGSSDLTLPFIPTSCEPASLFDPVPVSSLSSISSQGATQAGTSIPVSHVTTPGGGWSPTSSLATFGQFDVFAPGEAGDFDAWYQSFLSS
jgi:hypothetical protein